MTTSPTPPTPHPLNRASINKRFLLAVVVEIAVAIVVAVPVVWAVLDRVTDTPTLLKGVGVTIFLGVTLSLLVQGQHVASRIAVPIAFVLLMVAYLAVLAVPTIPTVASPFSSMVLFSSILLIFGVVVFLAGSSGGLIFGMGNGNRTQYSKKSLRVIVLSLVVAIVGQIGPKWELNTSATIFIAGVVLWLGYVGDCAGSWVGEKFRQALGSFVAVITTTGRSSKRTGVKRPFESDIALPAVGFAFVYFYGVLWCGAIFYGLYRTGWGAYTKIMDSGVSVPLS